MNNDWSLEKPNYFLAVPDGVTPAPALDYLIRVYGLPGDKNMGIIITETDNVKRHFSNIYDYFKFIKDTLVEVILSQKISLDYNGFYNAFLMQQITKRAFIK